MSSTEPATKVHIVLRTDLFNVCQSMFAAVEEQGWKSGDSKTLERQHHASISRLVRSWYLGCYICNAVSASQPTAS